MDTPANEEQVATGAADAAADMARSCEGLRQTLALGLCLATLLVFALALRNGFVNWDDDVNIVNNTAFRGLGAQQLAWMFTTFFGGHYQPLTWLTFAFDYSVWGLSPFGFHLTNIVLHMIATVLFFYIALRLLAWAIVGNDGGDDEVGSVDAAGGGAKINVPVLLHWCAAFAAAVFALHPLRVESVVWATERRDVLSGALLFGSVLAYLKANDRRSSFGGWYGLSLGLFVLSLLSKASGMVLPIVLLVLDVYPLRRPQRGVAGWGRLIAEKLPFLTLGVAAAVVAGLAQRSAGTMLSLGELGIVSRLAIACYGLVFYVYKLIMPTDLSPLYALPEDEALLRAPFLLAGVAVVAAVVAAIVLRRRWPWLLATLVVYVVLLAPVSGLAQSGKQLVADRYSYLSLLPFALLIAGGLFHVLAGRNRPGAKGEAWFFRILAGVYVIALSLLTAAQTTVWHDSLSLWDQAVEHNQDNSVAQVNLADALRKLGHDEAAAAHFQIALKLDDSDARAHNGLGVTLIQLNDPVGALTQINRAVELDPQNPQYLCNQGFVLAGFGRFKDAAAAYRKALDLAPQFTLAARGDEYGSLLVRLGRYEEARDVLRRALDDSPGNLPIMGDLAWLLATCPDGAVRDGKRAVDLAEELCRRTDYQDPHALDTLAAAYAEAGDFENAKATARSAINLATQQGDDVLADEVKRRLAEYENSVPYRTSQEHE